MFKDRRWAGPCALSVSLFILFEGLAVPALAAPSKPVEVTLEDAHMAVSLASNETGKAILNGTVQTNYPGLAVSVDFGATCDGQPAYVSPSSMTLRGVAQQDFQVLVPIPWNTTDGADLPGTLVITALISYPGGSSTWTSSETFDVKVLRTNTTGSPMDNTNKGPGSPDPIIFKGPIGAEPTFLLVLAVLLVFFYLRRKKRGSMKARGPKGRPRHNLSTEK